MQSPSESPIAPLLRFNRQVIDQASSLLSAFELAGRPDYADPIGAHLRHVIEHYEALLSPARAGFVDYDKRARDRRLEQSPAVARERLQAARARLADLSTADVDAPLTMLGVAGQDGSMPFSVESSLGRELVFAASHAIHHFALLRTHCQQHGIPTDADFGKAPATSAHERATPAIDPSSLSSKDLSCKPQFLAA